MDILYGILILVAVGGIAIGGVWGMKKLNITSEDLKTSSLFLDIAEQALSVLNLEYNDEIEKIIDYIEESIELVDEMDDVIDIDEKKEIIFNKTKEICENENIELNEEIFEIIEKIIDFAIDNNYIK